MCGHTFLYSPPVRAVKRLVDDGTLGELYFASASRVNLGPYRRDVSVVWDLGPHDFSILLSWFGETPASLRATGRAALSSGIADVAFITLTFASGSRRQRRAQLAGAEQAAPHRARGQREDGRLRRLRHRADPALRPGHRPRAPESFGQFQLSYRTGDVVSPRLDSCEPLVAELADFARAARRATRCASSSTWPARSSG